MKIFPLVNGHLNEKRRKVVRVNDAWGAGLQPLGIMLTQTHYILSCKLREKNLYRETLLGVILI
jgi:hypothetical protein